MGTHPIFESDFDCLTDQSQSRMNRFRNVAIVGAGQIGIGIAQVAAVTGHSVTLNTPEVNKTNKQIERNLKNDNKIRRMKSADQKAAIANALSKIKMTSDLSECVGDANLVVEAVEDDLEPDAKRALFVDLERFVAVDTLIAHHCHAKMVTDFSIERLSRDMARRENFGGVQFYFDRSGQSGNAARIVKCVTTSQNTFEAMDQWATEMGKQTSRYIDTPDFIIKHGAKLREEGKETKLLHPYMMEALRELETGNDSFQTIDEQRKCESALPLGPFELLDYIGLDTAQFIIRGWHDAHPHEELHKPSPIIDQLVASGCLGKKTGRGFYQY